MSENIYLLLQAMGGDRQRAKLAGLWRNWAEAVGEEFAWVCPLGHKAGSLFLGVEDAMEMQEASMQAPEILARVNAWLDMEYFDKIKISLNYAKK